MKKSETINTFNKGLIMDLNPLVTPNDSLVNCLNGTLITYNGNENVLLNDMGNGRVETAYLPEGYVPLGTAELGGIIYIVSYNPLINKCLVGSFPSPERNITSDEFINGTDKAIRCLDFYCGDGPNGYKFIASPYQKLILTDQIYLHPGDKFQIYSPEIKGEATKILSAFGLKDNNPDLLPKYLKFNVMAVTEDGKMTNLNHSLVWLPVENTEYYIRNDKDIESNHENIEEYRNLVSSNYNVFQTKTSGRLGIVAELECIDSFDIAWEAIKSGDNWNIYLYTNWTYKNDYSKDQINLFGIYYKATGYTESENTIKIQDYPTSLSLKSDTDIQGKDGVTFYNPAYISNIQDYLSGVREKSTEPRNNDGSDNLFLITTPISVPAPDKTEKNAILKLNVMPLMPFGILKWMGLDISINLSKLGSGSIDLVQYKYYVDDEVITLNYGIEAYLERNKAIKNITINFYEIDSSIISSIKKVGKNFDENRICNDKWQVYNESKEIWVDSEGADFVLSNPAKSILNEESGSYSGYFSEVFSKEGLINDYSYVVEISINYNDEKNIKYYRIFYNSDIFNSYYNNSSINDYRNITLDDEIEKQILYSLEVSTEYTENSTNFETSIPSMKDEAYSDFLKYNIVHKHYGMDTAILSAKANSIFSVGINNINVLKQTHQLTNKALANQITNLQTSSIITVDKIQETSNDVLIVNKNVIVNNFKYDIRIPLQITYSTKAQINISYLLEHATCTHYWLIYRGRDRYHHLSLYPNISGIANDGYYLARDSWGDDTHRGGNLGTTFINCYTYLLEMLDKYDIIALPTMGVFGTSGKGTQDVRMGFNNDYNINATKESSWSLSLQSNSCGIFYAMKTLDGQVIVFSFKGGPHIFKTLPVTSSIGCLKAVSKNVYNITDNASYDKEEIPEYIYPLRGYYIPKEYSGDISKYQWTTIEYYPDFIETASHSISGKANLSLQINSGIEVPPNVDISNLRYNSEKSFEVSYAKLWEILTSSLILLLTEISSDVYVMLPSGLLSKDVKISRNNVYDYEGNKIDSIANWLSGSAIPVISKQKVSSNTMTLCTIDGKLRIKQDKVDTANTGTIFGTSEEQSIKIYNIPVIPYVS